MKKLSVRKVMSILSTFIIGLSAMGCVLTDGINVRAENNGAGISNPRISDDGTVTWDKITFGNYPQDATFEAEPIKWRILDIDSSGNAFLLADESLDCKPYNTGFTSCTWETCTLRDWLNGTDNYANDDNAFIKAAFTDEERNAIRDVTIVNDNNPYFDTEGGNNTTDKIYLLSIGEASNISYGFAEIFYENSETRQAKMTDYACMNGTGVYSKWWLRSPGDRNLEAAFAGDYTGWTVNYAYPVRPALHVNLSSSFVKDAGKVTSEGNVMAGKNSKKNVNDYVKPSVDSKGVTTWDCVYFGNYKQKATIVKKPIEWRVLSVNGDDAFVVTDDALDCKPYNPGYNYCTWETCTLRDWLNGTDIYADDDTAFIKSAFTDEERNAIIATTVVNNDNPYYNIEGGNNTTDKIYLLSIGEVSNISYGFDGKFDESSKTRQAKATDYARMNGASRDDVGYCNWWLRSPGSDSNIAAFVYGSGCGNNYGDFTYYFNHAVRPALHVNLLSSSVKAAGTISSESSITADDIETQKKDAVIACISKIGTVTKDKKAVIVSARNAYNALPESAKVKVTNYSVLQSAEAKLAELEKQAKEEADKAEKEKQEITAAAEVDRLISAIGTVSANSKIAIDTARKAYNELSDGGKAKVTKLSVLETAEKTYADIEKNTNNSDNTQNTAGQQASNEQQQPTSTEQLMAEENVAVPAKAKIASVRNNKSKSFVVIWKKIKEAKGYEVQYALNKKFTKSKKTKAITSASMVSLTVKKLKKGKTYYVRVRAYNNDSKGSKAYGKWSAVKKIKIKK